MLEFIFGNKKDIDNLTQVYSRQVVVEYINFLISKNVPFSLALIDIDNFKYINDTYGHIAGDKILQVISKRLKEVVGEDGTVARFGGDEFMIVYPHIVEYQDVWKHCRRITSLMNNYEVDEFPGLFVTVTVGVSRFPRDEKTYEKLLETSDKALYRGKTKGRNCFIIYLPEKHANIELKTENDKSFSSMYLHLLVFKVLTKTNNFSEAINNIFGFMSNYFMVDHIAIQKGEKLLYQKIHPLSYNKNFTPLSLNLVDKTLNPTMEMCYLNQIETLLSSKQEELYNEYKSQKILAAFTAEISENYKGDKVFLRVESTNKRIWQHEEMDIYLTVAKLIGLFLDDKKFSL